jgi:hypothetical protein
VSKQSCQAAVRRAWELRHCRQRMAALWTPAYDDLERVARGLCSASGKDWSEKARKRNHWRHEAGKLMRITIEDARWARWMP